MRNIILSVIITGILTACDVKSKISNEQHSSTTVSVILDITDPRIYWPGPDQFLEMYHFKQMPDAEGIFRLRTITDKRLSPLVSFRLADGVSMEKDNLNNDRQYRNKNIMAFYSTVRKVMDDFYSRTDTTQSLGNSECFRIIADELTFLTRSKSDKRILIVASDLMEKSDLLDSYTSLPTNPKIIAENLNQAYPVPQNLSGLTVLFLLNPRDRKEDQTFSYMVEVYKILLQPRGAELRVQANL